MPTSEGEPPGWDPGKFALQVSRWADPRDAAPTTVLLQHPTAPFARSVDAGDEAQLRARALEYLRAADERGGLGLPAAWLDGLEEDGADKPMEAPPFVWLPIGARGDAPVGSFWFEREVEEGRYERTLILLAAQAAAAEIPPGLGSDLGSEFGIRVVAHLRPGGEEPDEVRFTGLSATLPFGRYADEVSRQDWDAPPAALLQELLGDVASRVGSSLRLQAGSVFCRGVRLGKRADRAWQVEIRGRGVGVAEARHEAAATPYEFVAEGTLTEKDARVTSVRRIPPTACAMAAQARVFPRDPASQVGAGHSRKRRPQRPERARDAEAALDTYRVTREVLQQVAAPGPAWPLQVEGRLEVLKSRFVLKDHPANEVKAIELPDGAGPPVRSDDFSALEAFLHLWQLFERFDAFGIAPGAYFKAARLPLKGLYRSGISPGPGKDGQTVNARVQPDGWASDDIGPAGAGNRPTLSVHLALGDLSRRARTPWNHVDRSQAEPLGIAADVRWIWHEIGHVLLMASVGELEFRFAHSAGDALAAIVADPTSDLATDENRRGETFPWVFVPRRHDRCVRHGWSWSGSLHRQLALVPDADRLRRKGYWTEQILSSSLFRLYRCLGGDTLDAGSQEPDQPARSAASDYAVYLVMKGIGLLGDALYAPANRPEQLVAALIEADIGTTVFAPPGAQGGQIGGCAHKVIRWAFEAQGMYPAEPAAINNAPGRPPAVDIYIQDRRPGSEVVRACAVEHGPGSYVPVSLHEPLSSGQMPAWFALDQAVRDEGGEIFVTVGNRGHETATAVTVAVWWRVWPEGEVLPPWDRSSPAWVASGSHAAQDIPPGASTTFGGFTLGGTGRRLVLAQATCADDRANTDPATLLPCSLLPAPLPDLVAGDNNLGLIVVP